DECRSAGGGFIQDFIGENDII
ncbi:hypothetical protein Q604_UNBC09691G0002, partial [human gut metagenome]